MSGERPSARGAVVNAAGLVQGIALVTFPAASTIFTSPGSYDLSRGQYGLHVRTAGQHGDRGLAARAGLPGPP